MDDIAKLKDKAAKLWAKGSWGSAQEAFEELAKAEPRNLMHRLRVGDALVKQGKNQEAIGVYAVVAERYAADGMLIKAISVNKLILNLDPQQKDTQKRLAALYSKRGVATVAARAQEAVDKRKDAMDLPESDGDGVMVIESGGNADRVIPNSVSATPGPPGPPRPPGPPGPPKPPAVIATPPPVATEPPLVVGTAPPVVATPQPTVAVAPQPPTVVAPPIVVPPQPPRPAELIELGPTDEVIPLGPESMTAVADAVEQAKQDLKDSGSDIDVDSLFDDMGEIPQVPPTPLFSDLQPAEFERLIELLAPVRVPGGTLICREGEPATSMFVIAQGSVNVFFTDDGGNKVALARLAEGDFFGEFALFEGGIRKASVESNEETELLELDKVNFDRVVAEFPAAAGVLRMFYYARLADTFLARHNLFGMLTREGRWDMVRRMTLQRYNPNQPILNEGDAGDALYMIRSGNVRIYTGRDADAITLADLPVGEMFGEIAVINLQPRTATVLALSEVEVYRLDRESARKLLSENKDLASKVKEIAEARVRSTIDAMITGSVGNTGR